MSTNTQTFFQTFQHRYQSLKDVEMSLQEYLEECKADPLMYASANDRMLAAIGEPMVLDTAKDPRLGRIFLNKKIRIYPTFSEFYGMEDAIDAIVAHFRHAAQGLEERKQILYLLGPVAGGKSSLVERIKQLFEAQPFYALKAGDQVSPIFESPLGLFDPDVDAESLKDHFNIPRSAISGVVSPWAVKRLKEFDGDVNKFSVVKVWPSFAKQIAITNVEPGDPNNTDISVLVGKVDIRKLEDYSQHDPDAYSWTGGLNIACQGILDFIEMFKADIKVLNPLLTATQEGRYVGTERFGAIPFRGIIMAHSNESEWEKFRNNKTNEAFIDRVNLVKVPYCLRVSDEVKIYDKMILSSALRADPCAPGTLEMLARFTVLSRLKVPENSTLFAKMEIYDGKNLKDTDPKAKPIQDYRDAAGTNEGMSGVSTRAAYKILSKVYNFGLEERAANPVHLMKVIEDFIRSSDFPEDTKNRYTEFLRGVLAPKYAEFLQDELQKAYIEAYSEYGQNLFDRYIMWADAWIQNQDFRDPDTGEMYDRESLEGELSKIEKAAEIANPKDFRNEVVNFVLRAKANNGGNNPSWTSYEKLRAVIEKKMFSSTEEMMPVISFGKKSNNDEETKHKDFVARMVQKGYTEKQVRLLVDWYMRYKKSH